MSTMFARVAAAEVARLESCVLEPVHIPSAIQAHGALVTVDLENFTILQASSNCLDILGVDAQHLLGTPLAKLVGPSPLNEFRDILNWEGFGANPVRVSIGERQLDAIFHESDGVGVVDFEPRAASGDHHRASAIYAAIHRLAGAKTVSDLLSWTARELRHLTKYDQVVVYRFHPDDHGEVVAEACGPGRQLYLGHHFPASDIPIQARRLYLQKMSRAIFSTESPTAELLPPMNPLTGEPVDLTLSELRAISPRHLEFMRNMGQASTLSFSLVEDGVLFGMITCSDPTAKSIPYALRQGYEMLARQVALQWVAMERINQLVRRETLRGVRLALIEQLDTAAGFGEALTGLDLSIANLVQADAAAVRVDGKTFIVGRGGDAARVKQFLDLLASTSQQHFASDALRADRPDLAAILPTVSGILAVPFGSPGNFLAWFRRERVHTVRWMGDPSAKNRTTPLSPRNSFETWSQAVSAQSLPWDEDEVFEAAEFSRDLDTALLN